MHFQSTKLPESDSMAKVLFESLKRIKNHLIWFCAIFWHANACARFVLPFENTTASSRNECTATKAPVECFQHVRSVEWIILIFM